MSNKLGSSLNGKGGGERTKNEGSNPSSPKLSIIITAKNQEDPKLKALLQSIDFQSFLDYEVLVITEGTAESAKAIGLKQARGKVVCFLASDNLLADPLFLYKCMKSMDRGYSATTTLGYSYFVNDDILNRYFALIGVNDPIPYYLDKNDRFPHGIDFGNKDLKKFRTFGDNGFFIRRDLIMQSDLEHYYHIDNVYDIWDKIKDDFYYTPFVTIWHRTGGNIVKFFMKRLKYADQFNTPYRRFHMVERQDIPKLIWFVLCTITFIEPISVSIRGYRSVRDKAWFFHLPVCLITLGVYSTWVLTNMLKRLFSSAH